MIISVLISLLCFVIGLQIGIGDLNSIRSCVNYKIGIVQKLTVFLTFFSLVIIIIDTYNTSWDSLIFIIVCSIFASFLLEWGMSKINCCIVFINIILRVIFIIIASVFLYMNNSYMILPFLIYGVYITNCPFGVVHGKDLRLSSYIRRSICYKEMKYGCKIPNGVPNFSYAGCKHEFSSLRKYNILDFQILPNSTEDLSVKIQKIINTVGEMGGGLIFFPKGRYLLGNQYVGNFLQINHSNIVIEGEVNPNGEPITEFVCCSSTLRGKKNPWLSPFFITTGEALQQSNVFWGLQFRRKKKKITRSGSLADPGSDGTILSSEFATKIIATARKGDTVLKVKDAFKIGKYILIGLYNTTKDGDLIHEILGVEYLRPEWETPLRAGEEEAPSYQWLIEVAEIVDANTICLSQPLWRDCNMDYEPVIYNVEMLENIAIRNLKIQSRWNGLFRHHGFPIYYNIKQAQEMDYGWNAVNMKRVAHGIIENVVIRNFSNPLYVMDSRNVTCKHITICGYDGHQGLKIYEHACDNLFQDITFYSHYADMVGGEGNAYGNVFSNIKYKNSCFKPVDFDFHGFSEGPMSPPAYNLFECFQGFRYIKTAAALYNLPGCATHNVWWNIEGEGETKDSPLFVCLPHMAKSLLHRMLSSISRSIIYAYQKQNFSIKIMKKNYIMRMQEFDEITISKECHQQLYHIVYLYNYRTLAVVNYQNDILIMNDNELTYSLYDAQTE